MSYWPALKRVNFLNFNAGRIGKFQHHLHFLLAGREFPGILFHLVQRTAIGAGVRTVDADQARLRDKNTLRTVFH
jgi:hypothetical protein